MHRKLIIVAFALVALLISVFPARTWVYQDGTPEDLVFEEFGPRADKLLIKLYSGASAELDGLENGEIDTTDRILDEEHLQRYSTPPWNVTINPVGYTDMGFQMLDVNNNNEPYLGNPPDPECPNPVYPNPMSVLSFRQAIAHLVNRTWLDTIVGGGQYLPLWVPMSPALGPFYLGIPNPYPYDRTMAEALLDADGFPVGLSGWRYWDRNGNGVEDPGEYLELRFVIRIDHDDRHQMGDKIADELNSVEVRVNRIYATAAQAYTIVMIERNFHLYTGSYYIYPATTLYQAFHSSAIPTTNFNGIKNTLLDYWLERLINATNKADAIDASHNAQQTFVDNSFKVPLWCYVNYKAMYRRYTGGTAGNPVVPDDGENIYRNITWQGAVNMAGQGIDNFFSFLNMHPTGFACGDGENMTIRHGLATPSLNSLNIVYAQWPQDWQVLDLIYGDRLIKQDPSSLDWMPWLAKNFTVGTYIHPAYGNSSKVKITMRANMTWQDGTPLTTADVYFTFAELNRILKSRGYPPPWWHISSVIDFKQYDPYNFEILFNGTESPSYLDILALIGSVPIIPKHVWKPIALSGDPTTFAPDPNMISSGPWRFKEYMTDSHVLLVKNKRGSIVQTNLPGSVPVQSPCGYFRLYPVYTDTHFLAPYEYRHRLPPMTPVALNDTLENLIQEAIMVQNVSSVDFSNPVSSVWNETWPVNLLQYTLSIWIDDDLSGYLSGSDKVGMTKGDTDVVEWYHVERLLFMPPGPIFMRLEPIVKAKKYVYLDNSLYIDPMDVYLKPKQPHIEWFGFFGFLAARRTFKTALHIQEPNWDSWKLNCTWINYTFIFWATIREDICGTTLYDDLGFPAYPYKAELPSPDIKVDIKDIARVAGAFGSYPGHPRWSPIADINNDYKIDIMDLAPIAAKFGWHG